MRTIIFDQDCAYWSMKPEFNRAYLEHQKHYLEDKLKMYGYLYLNDVYESLGIVWDPRDNNICYRKSEDFGIDIQPMEKESYLIKIH